MNVYIDLDGPILNVYNRYFDAYLKIVEEYRGISIENMEDYIQLKRDAVSDSFILKVSGVLTADNLSKYLENTSYFVKDVLVNGVMQTITQLKSEGHRIVLITNRGSKNDLNNQLTVLHLIVFFDKIIMTNHIVGLRNKAAAIRKIEGTINKGNALIVGDTESEILMGKMLCINTVSVLNGMRNKKRLTMFNPDYIIDDINGVLDVISKINSGRLP